MYIATIKKITSPKCHAYFSLGKEAECPHSKPIRGICRRRIMENRLADGLVIFLNVPYIHFAHYNFLNSKNSEVLESSEFFRTVIIYLQLKFQNNLFYF